jgi:hypothetical protein
MTTHGSISARRAVAGLAVSLGAMFTAGAHEIEFASIAAGRAVLGASDEFVSQLSPFDRAARLESANDVSEAEYLAFVMAAAREWAPEERARLTAAFAAIEPRLEELLPELGAPILLVKTTGEEEGGAGYTRANAIMLPNAAQDEQSLQRLLAHEIFHVASRNNPELKRALYRTIGFELCGEVVLPPPLAVRKMTNPDAPVNEDCIRLTVDGADVWGMPVLLSREERFDPAAGQPFFGYLTLSILLIDRADPAAARPLLRDGSPVLVPFNRVRGFFEQVGNNTNYTIHAEEILASNFELLVLGEQDVPSPVILERMRLELTRALPR